MSLDLTEIKRLHDEAFNANQNTRERAADDRVFAYVTQWDDGLLEGSQLAYRGEFNIIRKAQRDIMADLRQNPIQIDFVPKDEDRDDGADLLDGLFLTDDRRNSSLESYDVASQEAVDCGVGGWELFTEYDSTATGDKDQVIRRRPIYEANNNSFPDPNAKRLDKSDARYWSILVPYSKDGYEDLYEELTGKEHVADPVNFSEPEQSYTFPWVAGKNELFYVVRFYYREKVKDTILTMTDPFGNELMVRASDIRQVREGEEISIEDELIEAGYDIVAEKEIKRWQVTRYIASGEDILKEEVVAGDKIPVVHTYGERAFVEGEEIWEGVVRLAKDPQRLRNFMLSYLADIVSRSPREKPIFFPEQIAGYEYMYELSGADNAYPYALQHRQDPSGNDLPIGPPGIMPASTIPPGVAELVNETREAVKDVADPGLPNDMADPDLSGYAIEQLQSRFDRQSMVYQENMKFAKRWDAEIYASMASVVYDTPRTVTITQPDGSRTQVQIMEVVMDEESGEPVTINDLTNQEFEVFAEIGQSYTSKKEKTRDELGALAQEFVETDPNLAYALNMKRFLLMDGIDLSDLKEYARKQLLIRGFREPEDEDDELLLEQAQAQQDQPDPNMVLAMAEDKKGQAAIMSAQSKAQTDQAKAQTDQAKAQTDAAKVRVDAFRAETDRYDVMTDAKKAGVSMNLDQAKIRKTNAETIKTLTEPFRGKLRA